MKNAEKEKEINNPQNYLDLNDLFQRTYEFDIFKYVSRGLIKSQQNYENQLKELKLENLKTKKEVSSLKYEIELLKGNPIKNTKENINKNLDKEIKEITNEIEKKKEINNNKDQKRINTEITNEENYNSVLLEENKKIIEEKDAENNSNESMIKMANVYINELVNDNKNNINRNINNTNTQSEKVSSKNDLDSDKLSNEMKNIKGKLEDMDKKFNQFKIRINQIISESNTELKRNISDSMLKIKEESKKELTELNSDLNQKINVLNITTKTLNEKNEENEKLMNKTNSLNNTFLGKIDLINAKFGDYASNSDFEKYKLSIFNQLEIENREMRIDISSLKNSINTLKNEISDVINDTTVQDNIVLLKQRQEAMNIQIDKLQEFQRISQEKAKRNLFADSSRFIDIDKFNDYKNNQTKIIEKIKRENIDLLRDLTKVKEVDLINKTTMKDLKNLEDNIIIKLENLLEHIKERFVQKKYLEKYLKIYEYNISQSLEEFKSELKPGKNWILAKKPLGHLCASCEAYLGELTKYNENIKHMSKGSGENKNLKLSVGFSKVIDMVNKEEKEKEKDKYGSFSLDLSNINNGRNNSLLMNNKRHIGKNNSSNNNSGNISNNTSRINKLNLENNKSFQNEEYETEAFKNSLPQIKKINKNIIDNKRNFKHSFKSLENKRKFKESGDNTNYIIMMSAEQRRKNVIELGPKITKILKKINKNKNEEN